MLGPALLISLKIKKGSDTSLIHGFCDSQKWREACHSFKEIIEKGFLPQRIPRG
jgi:pentatricopeptide repeat protein